MINFPQRNWTDYGGEVNTSRMPRLLMRYTHLRAEDLVGRLG